MAEAKKMRWQMAKRDGRGLKGTLKSVTGSVAAYVDSSVLSCEVFKLSLVILRQQVLSLFVTTNVSSASSSASSHVNDRWLM
jgi:hypothetical protein